MEFVSDKICDDNMQVKINIKLVGDMAPTDPHYIDFFNKIMRKCLEHLRLQLIGRNYFDTQSKVSRIRLYFIIFKIIFIMIG